MSIQVNKSVFSLLLAVAGPLSCCWALANPTDGPFANDALLQPAMESKRALKSVFLGSAKAGNRMFLAGERGHIVYSDDAGGSWRQARVPVRTTLTALYFVDSQLGWAVGHDSVVLATRDGGETWHKQLDGYASTKLVHESARKRLTRLQQLQEAAASQADLPAGFQSQLEFAEIAFDEAERDIGIGPSKAFMDIWFQNPESGLVIGANGTVLRTEDGGSTWLDWSDKIGNPDLMHLYKLVEAPDGSVFLLGEAGMAYKSVNGGESWQSFELPYDGSLFGGFSRQSDSSIYFFGLSGIVLVSKDNGNSWNFVPTGTKSILQSGAVDDDGRSYLVGLGGVLLKENEDSSGFEQLELGGRSALTAVLPGEGQTLVVAGEAGIRVFNPQRADGTEVLKESSSMRFMFHGRD